MRDELRLQFLPWKSRPTDRTGDAENRFGALYPIGLGPNRIENAIGENVGFFTVSVTRQQKKFLASPADHGIGKPGSGIDATRHLGQNLVSNLVPEKVVDPLEVVDVDHIENKI